MEESNKPYVCFREGYDEIRELPAETKILVTYPDGSTWETSSNKSKILGLANKKKILYDGRYCAVAGFIYAIVNKKLSILANLRGPGCPDYVGYWNCPCGYLEGYEDSFEGISRETWEECGIKIPHKKFKIVGIETDPEKCNHGNVTIRHSVFLQEIPKIFRNKNRGGEEGEVAEVLWIPVEKIDDYKWAFGHRDLIKKYSPSRIKQFIYKYFKFII